MTYNNTINGFGIDNDGKIVSGTGWLQDEYSGGWYYFSDGEMIYNDTINGYHLDSHGKMVTGTGWIPVDSWWYYIDDTGKVVTNWLYDQGNWYYLYNSGGSMAKGWIQVKGEWYYLNSSGEMQTGWVKYGDSWYYFDENGKMKTGWIKDNGYSYYLKDDGTMAHDTTIDGYYLKDSGEWEPNDGDESGSYQEISDFVPPSKVTDGAAVTISDPELVDNNNEGKNLIDSVEDIASDTVDWTKDNYKKLIDYASDKLNSTGAAIVGSTAKAVSEIEKATKAFINENGLIQLYPDSSIVQTMKPFKRIAKVGTFITAISSTTKIITTWTDDSNNTFMQKIEKSGIQLTGSVVAVGAGSVNTVVIVALGLAEPETAGTSTAGIIAAVTLDYVEGEGIQAIQKRAYEKLGIEDK
ncbi:hypothetical protein LF65_04904 [Clostridium beijerinckii]|uniref:Toxin A n=1 Tax=Clostridium beijerinckii TaxID=1520 RepID=A0A0B5QTS2_CLOBE|nr:N-acetylmuramoyl-L-alanine amidase family protein [Clostridium beijerinckii]AJH01433.1 hypothetical protein LF65_04904 [Clostridium beijerinckii]